MIRKRKLEHAIDAQFNKDSCAFWDVEGFRINLKTETPATPPSWRVSPSSYRFKHRHSFVYKDKFAYDLTQVASSRKSAADAKAVCGSDPTPEVRREGGVGDPCVRPFSPLLSFSFRLRSSGVDSGLPAGNLARTDSLIVFMLIVC